MKIIVAKTEREFDETAAQLAARQLIKKPDSVMGFATRKHNHRLSPRTFPLDAITAS